jgi:hypothetical protein
VFCQDTSTMFSDNKFDVKLGYRHLVFCNVYILTLPHRAVATGRAGVLQPPQ